MSKADKGIPFIHRYVPNRGVTDEFCNKFCRCASGKIGIVTGYKLVLDTRPGKEQWLRHLYYGVNPTTGRDWQSFSPKVLSLAELQTLTWAWGSHTAKYQNAVAALDELAKVAKTPAMQRAITASKTGLKALYIHNSYRGAQGAFAKRRGSVAARFGKMEVVTLDAE